LAGRYRLGRILGRGAFGVVYQAVQEDLGRTVAVKILHEIHARDARYLKRFRREAEAAAKLSHPHVVQVTDFQEPPGEPALIVMEYLEGQTLGQLLRRETRLIPSRGLFIVNQILSGLGAAHRAGIAHRDLKPGNVFLTEVAGMSDIVKIVDFGISKPFTGGAITQLTRTGVIFGSPGYISPEQIQGLDADARSDVFAVGVVLFRCMTGELPFRGKEPVERLIATLDQPTPSVFDAGFDIELDKRIDEIIRCALAKHPQDRFQSAHEMRAALAPLVASLPDYGFEEPTAVGKPTAIVEPLSEVTQELRVMARPVIPDPDDDSKTLVDDHLPSGVALLSSPPSAPPDEASSDAATLLREEHPLAATGEPLASPRHSLHRAPLLAGIALGLAIAAAVAAWWIGREDGGIDGTDGVSGMTTVVASTGPRPDSGARLRDSAGAASAEARSVTDAGLPVDATAPHEVPVTTGTSDADRERALTLRRRGHRQLRARRWPAAEQSYRSSLDLEPSSAAGAAGLARALRGSGREDDALTWARRAVAAEPDNASHHLLLGDLLAASGDGAGARDAYRAGLNGTPRHRVLRSRLARLPH
jgi:serine/threonine protein kinase